MISPAPADFWERVQERVARLIFERETQPDKAAFNRKLPHLSTLVHKNSLTPSAVAE